jgi:hypothetical protein
MRFQRIWTCKYFDVSSLYAREACARRSVKCRMETQTVLLASYVFVASAGLAAIVVLVCRMRAADKAGRPAHAKASAGKSSRTD